jgi:hypothetical protein
MASTLVEAIGADAAAAAMDDEQARHVYWWCHLDESELRALAEMRAAVDDASRLEAAGGAGAAAAVAALPASLRSDLALLRFLKARSFDPERAIDMYLSMARWRLSERPGSAGGGGGNGGGGGGDGSRSADDHPNPQPPPTTHQHPKHFEAAFKRHYPHFMHKTDRWGRPVSFRLLGRADVDALIQELGTPQNFLRQHLAQNEAFREQILPACSREAGRAVISGVQVLDLEGFSVSRHFSPCVRAVFPVLSAVDNANFPEHLGSMVILNAPALFRSVWAAVRPFLDARTIRKIVVVGGGEAARVALGALIPPERLPVKYGGLSACDGFEDVGPWVEAGHQEQRQEQQEQQRQQRGRSADDDDGGGGDDDGDRRRRVGVLGGKGGGGRDLEASAALGAGGERRRSSDGGGGGGGGSSWGGASSSDAVARLLMMHGDNDEDADHAAAQPPPPVESPIPPAAADGHVQLMITSAACRHKHHHPHPLSPTPHAAYYTPRQSWTGDDGEGEGEVAGEATPALEAAAAAEAATVLTPAPFPRPVGGGLMAAMIARVRAGRASGGGGAAEGVRARRLVGRRRPPAHAHAE